MADRGHQLTDQMLANLEERIADEYAIASRDMQRKFIEYQRQFEEGKKKQKALLDAGKITQKDYNDWVYRHTMMGKQWEQMRDVLAQDMENANEIALKIARGEMPDVYALNANYGMYQIEHGASIDTGFTLYNHDAAELLMREQDLQLMPGPSTRKAAQIAADKSMQWNRQKIQSAVLQGIMQGESAYEVAARLRGVANMNYNASVRYARTMTTNAQNAGRYESYRRATKLGVDLTIEWQATLDGRTRHEHRMMHGQRRNVDEPFETPDGFTIMWPADSTSGSSDAPQSEIWNCRCTLLAWVKGFEPDTVKSSPKMGDMSFEEWQQAKPVYTQDKSSANYRADLRQFERYKAVLGDDAPKDIESFQRLKYNSPKKWEALKKEYRSVNGSRQRREKRERMAEAANAVRKPAENPDVVSWMKPIVGEHTRAQDLKAVNPNFDPFGPFEWRNNCQRCVTTYEARRRGYDVTALPCYSRKDWLATGTNYTLPYERGNRKANPLWYEAGLKITESRSFTRDDCLETIEALMNGYGNGSRAIIDGSWLSNGDGHVFIAEYIGGKVQFFDPQNNETNCLSYFDRMNPRSISIFRIDDLPFNSTIKEVFRNDVI